MNDPEQYPANGNFTPKELTDACRRATSAERARIRELVAGLMDKHGAGDLNAAWNSALRAVLEVLED